MVAEQDVQGATGRPRLDLQLADEREDGQLVIATIELIPDLHNNGGTTYPHVPPGVQNSSNSQRALERLQVAVKIADRDQA